MAAVDKLTVGIGTDPDVKVGPLIEDAAVDKVERHVADAVERGGSCCSAARATSSARRSSSRR